MAKIALEQVAIMFNGTRYRTLTKRERTLVNYLCDLDILYVDSGYIVNVNYATIEKK